MLETEPALLAAFTIDGHTPRSVMVITADAVYFRCASVIVHSNLRGPARHVGPATVPTPGQVLAKMSDNRVGGPECDAAWPARAQASL